MLPEVVTSKLDGLPVQPGVYLFKDKKGVVVYVGKAKSLRSRVRSYFQAGGTDNRFFIPILHRVIGDLDTIVTGSEKEATILENELIKTHKPRFNVKLRDDKDFLSLRLPLRDAWPRLSLVRRPTGDDGARYFGPYHSATAARRTLTLVNKHFQLRTCSDTEMASRKRPCLQHQIKRCPAPCVYEVDRGFYGEQVDAVAKFLDGRHDELSRELVSRMQRAAAEMRFELAAVYRDQLRAIEKVREAQRIVTVDDVDRDVIGVYREGDLVELALIYVRAGHLAEVATFSLKQAEIPDEEIIAAFLAQHYGRAYGLAYGRAGRANGGANGDDAGAPDDVLVPIPREIIVPVRPEGAAGIEEWLGERAKKKVEIVQPQRGPRVHLLELARDNAHHAFAEKRRASDDVDERLKQLQERLRLPTMPRRIECCDISHLGGGDTVGAVVAMKDGAPDKKRYRTFHVKGPAGDAGGDDYGAMYEVLARRFRRGMRATGTAAGGDAVDAAEAVASAVAEVTEGGAEAESEWELPDLFVVDGGRGQLGVALAAAHDLGLHELPIVGLAKEREVGKHGGEVGKHGGEAGKHDGEASEAAAASETEREKLVDRVYLPGQKNPIPLKSHSASLFFLARLRDEAHRFSNRAREKLGKARRFRSVLDDVKGIGPKTKKALLRELGTVDAIREAPDAVLLAVPGVTARHVKALRAAFGELPTKDARAN